ncbi:hypothetical protein BHYA_0137g00070 [Botrytis hyacinthi]|uniref:Uncharacterized protein n=1 Tax=Botrytis hyacinthi TaxID=278943 RepID=A0A4Z1GR48_9HELO|nr:hypothetical protein BHYA_0137g00070 [Botrytis hyacinthi]
MVFDNAIFAGTCAQDCRGGAVVTLFGSSRGIPSQGLKSDGKNPSWIPNVGIQIFPASSTRQIRHHSTPPRYLHDDEDFEDFEDNKRIMIDVSYIRLSVDQRAWD